MARACIDDNMVRYGTVWAGNNLALVGYFSSNIILRSTPKNVVTLTILLPCYFKYCSYVSSIQ